MPQTVATSHDAPSHGRNLACRSPAVGGSEAASRGRCIVSRTWRPKVAAWQVPASSSRPRLALEPGPSADSAASGVPALDPFGARGPGHGRRRGRSMPRPRPADFRDDEGQSAGVSLGREYAAASPWSRRRVMTSLASPRRRSDARLTKPRSMIPLEAVARGNTSARSWAHDMRLL